MELANEVQELRKELDDLRKQLILCFREQGVNFEKKLQPSRRTQAEVVATGQKEQKC